MSLRGEATAECGVECEDLRPAKAVMERWFLELPRTEPEVERLRVVIVGVRVRGTTCEMGG